MRLDVGTPIEVPPPPDAPREPVIDVLHGERVEDPYRWLEDAASPRVREWTDAQNARTRAVLGTGHGIGKPLDKQVDDAADVTSFLAWRLGLGAG